MEALLGRPAPSGAVERPHSLPRDDLQQQSHLAPAILLVPCVEGRCVRRSRGAIRRIRPGLQAFKLRNRIHFAARPYVVTSLPELVDCANAGAMAGPKRLDLHSSLPDMKLGKRVPRSEGLEMPLDSLEALGFEADQESA